MKITPFVVKGNGSSLWGKSNDEYTVNRFEVDSIDWLYDRAHIDPKRIFASVSVFGKNTKWFQYTDRGITKSLKSNKEFLDKIREAIVKQIVDNEIELPVPSEVQIGWSEQGMQPENGWNFDVTLKV